MIHDTNATHIVTHPFDGAGKSYSIGDRVDASWWRNTAQMVTSKFLRPMSVVEASQKPATQRSVVDSPKPAPKKLVLKKLVHK